VSDLGPSGISCVNSHKEVFLHVFTKASINKYWCLCLCRFWDDVANWFTGAGKSIANFFTGAGKSLSDFFGGAYDSIAHELDNIWKEIQTLPNTIGNIPVFKELYLNVQEKVIIEYCT